ncbi:conserved hypothetical protein [Xenorhabdus bovienii str. Jollieti]|uniref:Immunity protein 63 domain-containing protein n=1 Tax=Xenorhabdus bovienii (strain SS-2004) TaxID=406818 RepID=D3V7I4_XENBS|nr:Imm63 family immunity protein [Xenorhabdus bovienii]CBJ81796.1 conserved hypothetical protein [Xenorhabdus bovienii SS-2004]CDH27692.1 conserved hypothetical protein [Xenorhabdus bovienii str. Jollieti]
MLFTIIEIQEKLNELGSKLGLSKNSIQAFDGPLGDGTPYISFENNRYNLVFSERGSEFERKRTKSLDELLYWMMSSVVLGMAFSYELENRIEDQDCRRLAFPKAIELMKQANPEWVPKIEDKINRILSEHPYDDEPTRALLKLKNK